MSRRAMTASSYRPGIRMEPVSQQTRQPVVPKAVRDAGYTAVGLGVLALQQFHYHRRTAKAHVDSVVGEVRAMAEPIARSVGLDRLAAPVCSVVAGGKAFISAFRRS